MTEEGARDVRIRELRKARGWSQTQLGTLAGLAQHSVSSHETGRSAPSVEEVQRYAAIFGVSVDEVLGGDAPAGARAERDDIAAAISATARALDKAAEAMRMAAEAHLLLVKRYGAAQGKGE